MAKTAFQEAMESVGDEELKILQYKWSIDSMSIMAVCPV